MITRVWIFTFLTIVFQCFELKGQFEGKEPGDRRSIGSLSFCWCPKGEFIMGSPMEEIGRNENEKQVNVSFGNGFWMGEFEVTQREWEAVMKSQPWEEVADVLDSIPELPAVNVQFSEACEFCERLSQLYDKDLPSGWRFHLPTEAQGSMHVEQEVQRRFVMEVIPEDCIVIVILVRNHFFR
ncbi:MAG: SUMF1/EgtB/PvdO family nonheme iron enzyme [Pirellulales bacterium]